MKIPALFLCLLGAHLSAGLAAPQLDSYAQSLRIQAPEGVDPADLSVTVAPLYDDAVWALTQRWDDNLVDSLRVRDLLKRRHMHGTFYLNATDNWYGNETRYPFTGEPSKDLAKALLKGGNSIGGHTLSHSYVPALARPEMFYEALAVRIDREVNSQSPINSFVFPFTVFRNDLEGEGVHADIAAVLLRAGYLHVGNQYFNNEISTPLLDSWLLPCDGVPTDTALAALLSSPKQQQREPVICVCMHAWPAQWGGRALPKLSKLLGRLQGRRHWWYPNANELAAYRWQSLYGRLDAQTDAQGLALTLRRFEPWELGDEGPLTLLVSAPGKLSPTASLDGRALSVRKGRRKGTWLVNVPQSPGHSLPQAYEWQRNPSNQDQGLDDKGKGRVNGLASRLWLDPQGVHLRLLSREQGLDSLRVTWRLPLGYAELPPLYRDHLKRGDTLAVDLPLHAEGPALLTQGRLYAAAQVDALTADGRIRLYSDTHAAATPRDPSFPNGGFLVLGPLPGDRKDFAPTLFLARMERRHSLRPCETLFKGVQSCWDSVPAARREALHPELIPAGGMQAPRTFYTWDPTLFYPYGHKLAYLLASDVYSPTTLSAKALYPHAAVRRLQVNGHRVGKSRRFTLHPGLNRVLINYSAGTPDADGQGNFNMLNYGPFFRLVGKDGERLTDIRYQAPAELQAQAASPTAQSALSLEAASPSSPNPALPR